MNVISLIISLILIIFLAYKGYSTIVTAPLVALFTLLLTYGFSGHFMFTYTEIYMEGFASFVKNYFPLFLTGALLTYGGVSLFVVAFILYPIANILFKKLIFQKD